MTDAAWTLNRDSSSAPSNGLDKRKHTCTNCGIPSLIRNVSSLNGRYPLPTGNENVFPIFFGRRVYEAHEMLPNAFYFAIRHDCVSASQSSITAAAAAAWGALRTRALR